MIGSQERIAISVHVTKTLRGNFAYQWKSQDFYTGEALGLHSGLKLCLYNQNKELIQTVF